MSTGDAVDPPRLVAPAPAPSRPRGRRGLALAGVALVVGAAATWFGVRAVKQGATAQAATSASARPGAAAGPLSVEVLELAPRPVALSVTASGSLVANESVPVAAELQRRVVKVAAVDGARVEKGAVLFELDRADLEAQARELRVRKKLLAEVEARQGRMLAEGVGSAADAERARADRELVDAQLGSLAVTIARTTVRAPFAGRLGLRQVSVGAIVSPTTTLITLHDDARLKVDFTLPERYAGYVAAERPFTFRIAGKEKAFEAKVSAVEPAIDASSRSLRVRGLVDNAAGELTVGGFVTVDFPLESREAGLLLPSIAVVPSLSGHAVWVVKDGKATQVDVALGVRTEKEVEIVEGLAAGDQVIVTNLLRLRPGAPVTVAKAAK